MFWLLSRIAFLVAAFLPAAAFAGYAQLVPPPAFQPVGPGVTTIPTTSPANNFIYDVGPARKAVIPSTPMQINDYPFDNRAKYRAGFVGTRATLNVGTRTVGVPVALRVAAGAGRFAVAAFNPWVAGAQLAVLAVPFIIDWFNAKPDSGLSVDDNQKIVKTEDVTAPSIPGYPGLDVGDVDIDATKIKEGISIAQALQLGVGVVSNTNYCLGHAPTSWAVTVGVSAGSWCGYGATSVIHARTCKDVNGYFQGNSQDWVLCPSPAIVTREDGVIFALLEDLAVMAQTAIDPQALAELGVPIMVEDLPVINPFAFPEGQVKVGETNPAPELLSRPIRYPNGDPVLIPGTDPPLYTQPWYEVTPSPTVDNPWRVNIAHVTTTTNDPAPVPDPVPGEDVPPPIPDFYTDCDKFPGSVGCAAVGSPPDVETMPKETRTIGAISGPSFSGEGCPSNLNIAFAGHSFQIVDMSIPCGWISGLVKPIFILLSFISAVFIVRSAL